MIARALLAASLAACLAAGVSACGKGSAIGGPTPSASLTTSGAGPSASAASTGARADAASDSRDAELWSRAKEGAPEDLARLADRESAAGLQERARDDAAWKLTALRAMAFARDFSGLPWLAEASATGSDEESAAALDSAIDLAARPRRAVDPDDAEELKAGADKLLALAKDTSSAKDRRIGAIRVLRMLVDRHVVAAKDIPTDLDAK